MAAIMPTVGRIVLFTPAPDDLVFGGDGYSGPFAAIITRVLDPITVNLIVFNSNGACMGVSKVLLVPNGCDPPENVSCCQWPTHLIAIPVEMVEAKSESPFTEQVPIPEPFAKTDPEPSPPGPADEEKSADPVT